MYIGSVDQKGLHLLVLELVYNSLEEWFAGKCRRIVVRLHKDGGCSIFDDGSGMPVDVVPEHAKRFAEVAFSGTPLPPQKQRRIHGGGGLHGNGLKIVNALSRRLECSIARSGEFWTQEYRQGCPATPFELLGDIDKSSTLISFWPDPEIFGKRCRFNRVKLNTQLRELAFLNPGVEIALMDDRNARPTESVFNFPNGAADHLAWMNRGKKALSSLIRIQTREVDEEGRLSILDVAIQWTNGPNEGANYVNTAKLLGGPHVHGFHMGIVNAIRSCRIARNVAATTSINEICRGLTYILALQIPEPQYGGSTKCFLINPETQAFVQRPVRLQLSSHLDAHPDEAAAILKRIQTD
jgi:DNA gyrase subunit B